MAVAINGSCALLPTTVPGWLQGGAGCRLCAGRRRDWSWQWCGLAIHARHTQTQAHTTHAHTPQMHTRARAHTHPTLEHSTHSTPMALPSVHVLCHRHLQQLKTRRVHSRHRMAVLAVVAGTTGVKSVLLPPGAVVKIYKQCNILCAAHFTAMLPALLHATPAQSSCAGLPLPPPSNQTQAQTFYASL